MRFWSLILIMFSLFVLNSACDTGIGSANEDFKNRVEASSRGKDGEAIKVAEKILKKSFSPCSKNPNLVYARERQNIIELRDWTYNIIPRPYPPTKTERANQYGWSGVIMIRANSSKRIDTLNCTATKYEEGTQFPNDSFVLTEENGNWRCDMCQEYEAPSCDEVKKILAKCDPR